MQNIRLFIENREIDLDKNVEFAITKQFEDLTNPTVIINDWSKTVEIPFTTNNNTIFGNIYNADRQIADGDYTLMGIYFNPLKKLDFRLEYCGDVVMSGYAKMNSIEQKDGRGSYNITLNGQLGKIFQELKKLTFDVTLSGDTNYHFIDASKYYSENITKELVKESWEKTGINEDTSLFERDEADYDRSDVIGYAPNNTRMEEFDYKSYQASVYEAGAGYSQSSVSFEKELENNSKFGENNIKPSDIIKDGLTPRGFGEFRSYHQVPFIWWNKLFQIFTRSAEEVTGYEVNYNNIAGSDNPYWHNLVMLLQSPKSDDKDKKTNYYQTNSNTFNWVSSDETSQYTSVYSPALNHQIIKEISYDTSVSREAITIAEFDANDFVMNKNESQHINFDGVLKFHLVADWVNFMSNYKFNNTLIFEVEVQDENGAWIDTIEYSLKSKQNSEYVSIKSLMVVDNAWKTLDIDFPLSYQWYPNSNHNKIKFVLKPYWNSTNSVFMDYPTKRNPTINLTLNPSVITATVNTNYGRSGGKYTINSLWNKEINLFDTILKYCKMLRIGIFVDDFKKKIIFKPLNKYFQNYSIVDWTDKLDKSKDYTIKPISFSNKYVLLNYDDDDRGINKKYKEKTGYNFGEKEIITDYNFNTNKDKLFSGLKTSIMNTDTTMSWYNLSKNGKIEYGVPGEKFINLGDESGKYKSGFGQFYFYNGRANFESVSSSHTPLPPLYMQPVYISDDTDYQNSISTYMFTYNSGDRTFIATYPNLDVYSNGYMCLFAKPSINYTYLNDYGDKTDIYTAFWKKYIDERYSANNKLVTCYLRLKPMDFSGFEFNQFIKIENQLYFINKIYDYNITSNESTKVDLITINDITGYTENNFN